MRVVLQHDSLKSCLDYLTSRDHYIDDEDKVWVLIQSNSQNLDKKYLSSHNYNDIISYINGFCDVKKYGDYLFISRNGIYFNIKLGEELLYEEESKKKEFIEKITESTSKKRH